MHFIFSEVRNLANVPSQSVNKCLSPPLKIIDPALRYSMPAYIFYLQVLSCDRESGAGAGI